MNEPDLIASSQRGDLDAFNRIVELYQGQVYNVAYRMVGSQATAEDVAQEVFISAYRHVNDYRGGSFKSWLLRITTNACYNHLRATQRQRSTSLEDLQEVDPSWQPKSPAEAPEEHALRMELAHFINEAFLVLTADQRATIILSDIEGLSYEEIAKATGTSLGTVKSRLSRARTALREYFVEHRELLPSHFRQK